MAAVDAALTRGRILTLTGAPGIGKSAIAEAVAMRRPDPLLVRIAHGRDAIRAIATSLGIQPSAPADEARLAAQIGAALAHRGRALVVLDDADLATSALATHLPAWHDRAPSASFVVTSRTRLGVAGETLVEIGPLELPESDEIAAIQRSAAVRVFAEFAAQARPGFRISASNAHVVADVVCRLGGVPLALELCAARTVALSEADILDMLSLPLDFLDDGRGRLLRSAFELSWKELSEDEARMLAATSLFRGSFDFDAISAATDAKTKRDRLRAAKAVESLVTRSLVRVLDRRYFVSESLGAFAHEKLEKRGEHATVAERLAQYYGTIAPSEADRESYEEAARRALAIDDAASAARVLLRLAPLALAKGPLASFVDLVDRVASKSAIPDEDRAELLLARGTANVFQGSRDKALDDLATAASLAKRCRGLADVEALAASKMALVVGLKKGVSAAKRHFESAKRAAARARDDRVSAIVSKDLANVLAEAGKNDEATALLTRARELFRAAGDVREEGFVAMMLGTRLLDEGALRAAKRDLDAALVLLRRVGDLRSEAWTLAMRALVDAEQGDVASARARLEASLDAIRAVGDTHTEGIVLTLAGNVALELGLFEDAENSYRDAVPLVHSAGDTGLLSLARAGAAIADHALGRAAAASDGMKRAVELSVDDARAARREAVRMLALVLDDPKAARAAAADEAPAPEEVRFARRAIRRLDTAPPGGEEESSFVVARDGSWVRVRSGQTFRLRSAQAAALVLKRLALERLRRPGVPVSAQVLVRAGWPDERILPKAAKNRLHVTIARLRQLGLSSILVHDPEGYMLDPREALRLAEPGERAVSGRLSGLRVALAQRCAPMRAAPLFLLTLTFAACSASETRPPLGGGEEPSQLPDPTPCSGLRCNLPTCEGGKTTAIEGDVYDPAGKTRLYNVLAYVPNETLEPFAAGATCDRCGKVSGDPIASAVSDDRGHFRIVGVPAGDDVPLVLQVGKWRRTVKLPHVEPCTTTTVTDGEARLPGRRSEGDVPRMAVVTGGFDELACLLTRIGVHATEYTPASGEGFIHVYQGVGGGNYTLGGATKAAELWKDEATLSKYDLVVLACEGWEYDEQDSGGNKSTASKEAMRAYLGRGGRVFASHYHYTWFKESPASDFKTVATWNAPASAYGHEDLKVDTTFPKGAAFSSWLVNVGASALPGLLPVDNPSANVAQVNVAVAQRWLYGDKGVSYMSFNAPVGVPAEQQCGRAVLSDVHVSGEQGGKPVPGQCETEKLTPQELALEFLLFDLASCVMPDSLAPTAPK